MECCARWLAEGFSIQSLGDLSSFLSGFGLPGPWGRYARGQVKLAVDLVTRFGGDADQVVEAAIALQVGDVADFRARLGLDGPRPYGFTQPKLVLAAAARLLATDE